MEVQRETIILLPLFSALICHLFIKCFTSQKQLTTDATLLYLHQFFSILDFYLTCPTQISVKWVTAHELYDFDTRGQKQKKLLQYAATYIINSLTENILKLFIQEIKHVNTLSLIDVYVGNLCNENCTCYNIVELPVVTEMVRLKVSWLKHQTGFSFMMRNLI